MIINEICTLVSRKPQKAHASLAHARGKLSSQPPSPAIYSYHATKMAINHKAILHVYGVYADDIREKQITFFPLTLFHLRHVPIRVEDNEIRSLIKDRWCFF